jgi:hypothetical protein
VMGRRGGRRKQLLDVLKEKGGYLKFKEETLDRALWRTRFGRDCRSIISDRITVKHSSDCPGHTEGYTCSLHKVLK